MTGSQPAAPIVPQDYRVYGMGVRSDIELPDWPAAKLTTPDVTVQRAPVPALETFDAPYGARFEVRDGELLLTVRGVARYSAKDGNRIRVDPEPGAKPEDVRLYLTGALTGTILHQRGAHPLHASCVSLAGLGVAFAGRSGAGKSTLVAALVARGATFVSDDICVLTPWEAGVPRTWPGAPRVKLDEPGLAAFAGTAAGLESAGGNRGKYHLPVAAPESGLEPVALHRIYLLTDGEGRPHVERLEGLDAVSALVDETYFLAYARDLGLASQVFRAATRLAHSVRVSRLVRPRGLEHLADVIALIEQDSRNP